MIDEMYLQKSAPYHPGEYVEEWNLYKEIFVIMVVGLKESILFVVQTILKVTFNGQWLAEKINDIIDNLIEIKLCVQVIVIDNISYKV